MAKPKICECGHWLSRHAHIKETEKSGAECLVYRCYCRWFKLKEG